MKKVPGNLVPLGGFSHEKKVHLDLKSKSEVELREILERERKLLETPGLIRKLADKGQRIKDRIGELEALLEEKGEGAETAAQLFSQLKIDSLEWRDNKKELNNVFETLASKEIPAKSTSEKYASQMAQKIDLVKSVKEKFTPVSSVSLPKTKQESQTSCSLKRSSPSLSKRQPFELMPLPKDSGNKVQMMSLTESCRIQKEQNEKLKDIRLKVAAERLKERFEEEEDTEQPDNLDHIEDKMKYRDRKNSLDDEVEEEEEVAEDEDEN